MSVFSCVAFSSKLSFDKNNKYLFYVSRIIKQHNGQNGTTTSLRIFARYFP